MKHAHELDAMTVPLYDKYYTHQDIKDLIVFLHSCRKELCFCFNANDTRNKSDSTKLG